MAFGSQNISEGFGIGQELESESETCLVGKKWNWNWNPILYYVWFTDISSEFDFSNAKCQNCPPCFSFLYFSLFYNLYVKIYYIYELNTIYICIKYI